MTKGNVCHGRKPGNVDIDGLLFLQPIQIEIDEPDPSADDD